MRHIKLYEQFQNNGVDLSKFIDVLDFPRENPEGFLEPYAEIPISSWWWDDYNAKEELQRVLDNPSILNDPGIVQRLKEKGISKIEVAEDKITVKYIPMTREEFEAGEWNLNDITYDEYLDHF